MAAGGAVGDAAAAGAPLDGMGPGSARGAGVGVAQPAASSSAANAVA